jgi:hypothetical protein
MPPTQKRDVDSAASADLPAFLRRAATAVNQVAHEHPGELAAFQSSHGCASSSGSICGGSVRPDEPRKHAPEHRCA